MTHPREGKGYDKVQRPRQYRSRANDTTTDAAQIYFRASPELRDRLYHEADRRMVSANLLLERALIAALDAWEKQSLT